MSDFEQGKRFADKTAKVGREAAAEAEDKGADQATTLMREFNVKLIDMTKANTEAVFDFAHRIVTAQPSDPPRSTPENLFFSFAVLYSRNEDCDDAINSSGSAA